MKDYFPNSTLSHYGTPLKITAEDGGLVFTKLFGHSLPMDNDRQDTVALDELWIYEFDLSYADRNISKVIRFYHLQHLHLSDCVKPRALLRAFIRQFNGEEVALRGLINDIDDPANETSAVQDFLESFSTLEYVQIRGRHWEGSFDPSCNCGHASRLAHLYIPPRI